MPRILIVEDSLDIAQTLSYLLRDSGHDVEYAINGYAALEIAKQQRPDVVLLDIGLPDFDGCELARRMKATPGLENTRIIAITGRVSDDRERALQSGCEHFFRKPVTVQVLESLIGAGRPGDAPGKQPDPRRLH